ncbi:glycosyltransferase family 2 protein [Candidatus Gottesmanbacteria bacterium]|nr:glycosyltransferase family 2 protein [Candidatus Gottesmanbacteria bacterium]
MHHKIKLSIIIVNFNTYEFLKNCIESIYKNVGNLSFEIIVVDNASTEELRIKNHELRIKLIKNKKNVGFAVANNQGIKQAKGEYILLLNPDTIVEKNTLGVVLDYMDKNPSAGVATCKVSLPSGELDDACHRGFPTPWNAICQFSGLARLFSKSQLFDGYHMGFANMDKVHEIDSCAGAFMLVRRKTGDKVGWLDEDYFWYGEDIDFCFRVKRLGWKVVFLPMVKIVHYKGVAGGIKSHSLHLSTADKETQVLATRSRFAVMRIFYKKHYQGVYPNWLTWLVMSGIKLKEYLNLLRLRFRHPD